MRSFTLSSEKRKSYIRSRDCWYDLWLCKLFSGYRKSYLSLFYKSRLHSININFVVSVSIFVLRFHTLRFHRYPLHACQFDGRDKVSENEMWNFTKSSYNIRPWQEVDLIWISFRDVAIENVQCTCNEERKEIEFYTIQLSQKSRQRLYVRYSYIPLCCT